MPCQMLTSRLGLSLSSWVQAGMVVLVAQEHFPPATMVLRQESGHIMAWVVALPALKLVLLEVREAAVVVTAQAQLVAPEFPVKAQQAEQVPMEAEAVAAAAVAVQAR